MSIDLGVNAPRASDNNGLYRDMEQMALTKKYDTIKKEKDKNESNS